MKTIDGDYKLNYEYCHDKEVHITGNLELKNIIVRSVPSKLIVDGNITIYECSFEAVPDALIVNGDLFVSHDNASDKFALPLSIDVKGDCYLYLSLRENVEFPEHFNVDGVFGLHGEAVTSMPKNLKVAGLDISSTSINKFPEDVVIEANDDKLEELGDGAFSVLEYCYGGICINDTPIDALPDNLSLKGNLLLSQSKVKKLPAGLNIGGILNISNTEIESLPEDAKFKSLIMDSTKIDKLPIGFSVDGMLSVNGSLTTLPDNLHVGGCLYVSNYDGIGISELPRNLRVGSLYLYKSDIEIIPNDITVGEEPDFKWYSVCDEEQFCKGTIYSFDQYLDFDMDTLKIPGDLYLLDTELGLMPQILEVGGDCYLDGLNIPAMKPSFPNLFTVKGKLELPKTYKDFDFESWGKRVTAGEILYSKY